MKEKSLKSNIVWNSIGSFVYLFCQWLLTWLIIKLSNNLEDAGNLSLAISITNVFFTIACFNMRPYLVSDNTNEYKVEDYCSFRFVTIIFSVIACFLYSIFFRYSLNQLMCIMIFMVYKVGEAIVDLFHAFEQRKSRMDVGGVSLLLRGIITITFFTLGMKLFNNLNVSLLLITVCTFVFIFFYDFYNVKKFEAIKVTITNPNIKKLFLRFLPLAIGSFFGSITSTLPKQYLEKVTDTKTLGIFSTIATPAVIVQVAATYIYNPLIVVFSDYRKKKNYISFKKLFLQTIGIVTILSIICYVGSLFFSKIGLRLLYGEELSNYYELFNTIIIYTALTGFLWFFHNILIIFRKIKSITIIYFIGFIVSFITQFYFVNNYKLYGVCYTLILSMVIMDVAMIITIIKNINNLKMKE